VSIELHCEGCGKTLKAPDAAAGKRSKCPACGHEVYIPTPLEQIEELPLAPEDSDELQREAALQAERRRLDRILARETEDGPGGGAPGGASQRPPGGRGHTVEEVVLAYLAAMRDSDFSRAEQILDLLRRSRADAIRIIDRLAADDIPPAPMAGVPAGVYRGFLKNLRSQL